MAGPRPAPSALPCRCPRGESARSSAEGQGSECSALGPEPAWALSPSPVNSRQGVWAGHAGSWDRSKQGRGTRRLGLELRPCSAVQTSPAWPPTPADPARPPSCAPAHSGETPPASSSTLLPVNSDLPLLGVVPPTRHIHVLFLAPESVNVSLLRERVFADVIKWKVSQYHPGLRGRRTQRLESLSEQGRGMHTQRSPVVTEAGEWSPTFPRTREGLGGPSPQPPEGARAWDTRTLGSWPRN